MNHLQTPLLLGLAAALTGCVTSHPQTADEFRAAVPGAFSAEHESFTVERPFSEVAHTFQEKAPQCLDVRVKTTSQTNMSYQVIVTKYNPTVQVTEQRAELHLQQDHEQGVMNVTEKPSGGYYLLVTDAIPLGPNQTQIDIYRPAMGYKHLTEAIRGGATGENLGCPDLTKV
jgi:hypothetical protein